MKLEEFENAINIIKEVSGYVDSGDDDSVILFAKDDEYFVQIFPDGRHEYHTLSRDSCVQIDTFTKFVELCDKIPYLPIDICQYCYNIHIEVWTDRVKLNYCVTADKTKGTMCHETYHSFIDLDDMSYYFVTTVRNVDNINFAILRNLQRFTKSAVGILTNDE